MSKEPIVSSSEENQSENMSYPEQYISGWITETLASGEVPAYGYPKNHLPAVDDSFEMTVKPGFMA